MAEKVVFFGCGGTIGMEPGDKGALNPSLAAEALVEQAPGLAEFGADIDVVNVFNMDSSNVGPIQWSTLINRIAEAHSDYDAVIVTHGTDTMAETGTATNFSLGEGLEIPITFTGSQRPINAPGTDARANLERSMQVVLEASRQGISEVMITFSDQVLRAVRSVKMSEARFDAFASPSFESLAVLTAADTIRFSDQSRHKGRLRLPLTVRDRFDTNVVTLTADPTTDPEVYGNLVKSEKCSAVVLRSLGAGNIPTEGNHSYLPLIQIAVGSGKPVILASPFSGGATDMTKYETGRKAAEAGAGHSSDMTPAATKIKLMWLLGQGISDPERVNEAMLGPVVGEVTPVNHFAA